MATKKPQAPYLQETHAEPNWDAGEDFLASLDTAEKQPEEGGLWGRVKQGVSSAVDAGRIAATDDPDKIAEIIAEAERKRAPATPVQRQMAEEIAPYVEDANKAEGVVDNVAAWGTLAAKRVGQFASNPGEFAGMVAESLPNSAPGIAGGLAGGVGGGTVAGPVGAVVGGVLGGTAGGYMVELGAAMQSQILKEAQARGVDLSDKAALSAIIAEKYPEFLRAARLKGIGTAGVDAALNVATVGLAGTGERILVREANALAKSAKAGDITAAQAAEGLAGIEARNAARNTLKAKAVRGGAITAAEMAGEGASEAAGQALAYDQVDAGDVVDESLLGLGTGAGMAATHKILSNATGATEVDALDMAMDRLRPLADTGPLSRAANAVTAARAAAEAARSGPIEYQRFDPPMNNPPSPFRDLSLQTEHENGVNFEPDRDARGALNRQPIAELREGEITTEAPAGYDNGVDFVPTAGDAQPVAQEAITAVETHPFKSRGLANIAMHQNQMTDTHEIVPVEGGDGFKVQRKYTGTPEQGIAGAGTKILREGLSAIATLHQEGAADQQHADEAQAILAGLDDNSIDVNQAQARFDALYDQINTPAAVPGDINSHDVSSDDAAHLTASTDGNSDVDVEETRIGLAVDQADLEALAHALENDIDPHTGKKIASQGFRDQYQQEYENLKDSVANAQEFLREHDAKPMPKADAPAAEVAPTIETPTALDVAAHGAATSPLNEIPQPSDAQKEAGNYAKGHVALHGLDITIENPVGSKRSGTDKDGVAWETEMQHHYGYIKGTVGMDKDHIDTFIGTNHDSDKVFVVDQVDPSTGKPDEHKVMLGFDSQEEAQAAYQANYDAGWTGGKTITETTVQGFKDWLKDGNTKKPFAKPVKEKAPAVVAPVAEAETPAAAPVLDKQSLNKMTVKDMTDAQLLQAREVFADGPRAPKVEKEIKLRGLDAAAAAPAVAPEAQPQKPVPELPFGQYGTPDQPLKFISGMSAPADFAAILAADKNVGISINYLSNASIPKIAQALASANGAHLFVDSGAFSIFMANLRAKAKRADLFDDFEEKAMDYDAILDRYEELHQAINKADDSGHTASRVFFVMPDIVGDQAGSLELVKQYADVVSGWGKNIVPLQGGELSLKEAYEVMMRNLGLNPDGDISPVLGIPSKAAAVSNAELRELFDAHGDRIGGVHILGAVADKTLKPRLDVLREAGYDGDVSADANRLRSLMWGDTSRAEAMRHLLHEGGIDSSKKIPAATNPTRAAEPAAPAKDGNADNPVQGKDEAAKNAPLENGTAPEHVQTGVDDRELGEIVAEFNEAQAEMMAGDHPVSNIFQPPQKGEVVRLADKAKVYHKDHGWMTPAEAKTKIAEWKAHAQAQGENPETRSANSQKIVLSLFDLSGEWSKPWEEAGYQVYRFDIQDSGTYEYYNEETGETEERKIGDVNNMSVEFFANMFGDFDGMDIHAVLAATPCTDFAVSGARHFAAKDADGRTVASVKLVHQTLRVIEYFKPSVWAIENPVGRIEKLGGLPPWRLSFDPNHLGDPYTKKTLLWGRFNGDLPVAPVEPTEGSKMWSQYGGKSQATKNARSVTPEGFSYGFFMANNAIDHPAMALANKFDRLDRGLIEQAIAKDIAIDEIESAVEDFYYMDLDDDAANDAIKELIAEHTPTPPAPKPTERKQPAAKPQDIKTYTTQEAKAEWDGAREGKRNMFLARIDQRESELVGKSWDDMTADERTQVHDALNQDFEAPNWYINTKGQQISKIALPPAKTPEQLAEESAAQRWKEMSYDKRYNLLFSNGIGKDSSQGQYAEWSILSVDLRNRIKAGFAAEVARVPSLYGGGPDPKNSAPMQELDGFKVGDRVKVNGRTIKDATIEVLFTRQLPGFDEPNNVARLKPNDGKSTVDVLTSSIEKIALQPTSTSPAVQDFIDGKRDDAPSIEEVKAEQVPSTAKLRLDLEMLTNAKLGNVAQLLGLSGYTNITPGNRAMATDLMLQQDRAQVAQAIAGKSNTAPSIEEVAAETQPPRPGVVELPAKVTEAIEGALRKQKAKITRLGNEAKADNLNLEQRLAAQTKLKAAETSLRQMRTNIFNAEDAAVKALETGDIQAFNDHEVLFHAARDEIQQILGQRAELPAVSPLTKARNDLMEMEGRAEDQGRVVDDRLLVKIAQQKRIIKDLEAEQRAAVPTETRNPQTLDDFIGAVDAGYKAHFDYAGENGRTVWIENTDKGWVLKTKDDDSNTVFTKGRPHGGGWAKFEVMRKAEDEATHRFTKWAPSAAEDVQSAMAGAVSTDHLSNEQVDQIAAMFDKPSAPAAQDDDLSSMFDDVVAEELAAREPAPAPAKLEAAKAKTRKRSNLPPAPRKTKEAATSAVKNTATGMANIIDGLGALFGGKGTLGSGPVFNDETYAKAKPYFQAAVADFGQAGADIKEVMRAVVKMVMDKFGLNAVTNMKPYVLRFIEEQRDEVANSDAANDTIDATSTKDDNGQSDISGEGPEALGDMAAAENGGSESGRGVQGSDADGGSGSAAADSGADGARVPGTRGRGSRSKGSHSSGSRTSKRGRLGGAGAGREGSELSTDDAGAGTSGVTPSAPNIPAQNFHITDDVRLGQGGEVEKFNDNLTAIRTMKAIESENRRATAAEQSILARYVGWGGLANAFPSPETGEFKPAWAKRGEELAELLAPKEYALARRSTLDSHYTSKTVVDSMWKAAARLGFKGGLALESSMGSGNFIGLMPIEQAGNTKFIGVEYDNLTARIATLLYPQSTVLNSGFQKVPLADGTFDLAIGNPPFGDQSLRFQYKPELNGHSIHNQFFIASLDALKPGGIQVQVVSRYLLDKMDKSSRVMLAKRAKLLGAIRLPDTAFKENARTEVVTDIVFLQRLTSAEEATMEAAFEAATQKKGKTLQEEQERLALVAKIPAWVNTVKVNDPLGGAQMEINSYFAQNPHMIMGVLERSGSMQYGADITVRLDKDRSLSDMLNGAIRALPENVMAQQQSAIDASLARHKDMSDALRIALAGHENGSIKLEAGGVLEQVIERETPEGSYELAKRTLSATSPWSDKLQQNSDGQWYTMETVLGADGKPAKQMKDGKPTKRNIYERKVFAEEDDIPNGLLLGQTRFERLREMVGLRDLLVEQLSMEAENAPAKSIEANRKAMAAAYAAFVKEHGWISDPANSALVSNMPDGALVQALEFGYRPAITQARAAKIGEKMRPASAKPAPILSKRVIVPYEAPTSAGSLADALSITMAETGGVNMERIASLLGKEIAEVEQEVLAADKPMLFKDPETEQWVTSNDYLSGQVKRKLNAARAAGMIINIKALEAVQPEAWTAENVSVLLGASWAPVSVYEDFIAHISGSRARVSFSALTNSYTVSSNAGLADNENEWASTGYTSTQLITDLLNNSAIRVMTKDSNGNATVHQEYTDLALLKAKAITNEFTDWVFKDSARRNQLVGLFNEKFNTRVNRQHDGSHLMLPGKVPDAVIAMRRHQKNAIWRGIAERFMLLDHAVGAGKTYTAIARAMERRRMGLSKKPTIVVPNHMVEQFTTDIYRLYPGAKVLAAGKKDFEKSRRRKLFAKIATGDFDIVIIPHSSFGFIDIAPETEERYLQGELDAAMEAVKEAQAAADEEGGGSFRKPFGVKQAERLVDTITARMENIKGNKGKDKLLTFEQMGIDDMTVDEAHEFKNLFYSSRLTGVKGMGNKTGSQKAFDLYNKVRVLRESPKGTVTFMTGTPISNSAVEMFTMMRYLAADELKELGLEHFDAWRAQFVSTDAGWEPNETGRLKEVNRLGRTWSNMRSLMELYYSFTDSVDNDAIKAAYAEDNDGKQFPIPKVMGGDRQSIVMQPTEAQLGLLNDIIGQFDSLPGIQDPYERNILRLRLMDRARKVSLDVRAADPRNPSKETGGKLEVIADNVKRIYDKWTPERGTQLIFLDRSVPKSQGDDKVIKEYDALIAEQNAAVMAGDEEGVRRAGDKLEKFDANEIAELRTAQTGGWNAYQQIKDNLIARGIPAAEIRFIQEANNDLQKQAMFDAVKDGTVRVLIGSTPRMGAGTNVQDRLVGLHHADVTWKPSDIEQREGRIIRQGNLIGFDVHGNPIRPDFEVEILAYATERTIDAKMWSLNSSKLKTINGIRKYDGSFVMEFEDEESVSMAELAALASGDPLLLERVKLMSEIDKLELLKRQYQRKAWGIVSQIEDAERDIKDLPARIETASADATLLREAFAARDAEIATRRVTVEGVEYSDRTAATDAVQESIRAQMKGDEKAKFSVSVGKRRLSSTDGALSAVADVMGDRTPFAMTIGDEVFGQRVDAAREIAEQVTRISDALESGKSETLEVGTLLGMKVEAIVERGAMVKQYSTTLALIRPDGSTLSSSDTGWRDIPNYTTASLRTAIEALLQPLDLDNIEHLIGRYQSRIAAAHESLPALREKQGGGFPQEDELDAKNARLEEVITLLSAEPVKTAPAVDAAGPAEAAEPAFSIEAAAAGSNAEAGANGQRAAISQVEANQVVGRVVRSFEDGLAGISIRVVDSFNDLPQFIIDTAIRYEAKNAIYGAYADNAVYLVRDMHATAEHLEKTLLHELYGHEGLHRLFGDALTEKLNGLFEAIGGMRGMQEIATRHKIDLSKYAMAMAKDETKTNERRIAVMMEELLAHIAQDRPTLRTKLKGFIGMLRNWLRSHGFTSLAQGTDADLYYLLQRARATLGGPGGGGNGGGISFARGKADPANPDSRFSIVSDAKAGTVGQAVEILRGAKTLGEATASIKDMLASNHTFSLLNRTVGTQFHKATKDADFKRVFTAYNQQTDDIAHYAIESEKLAPGVLQRLDGFADVGRALLNSGAKYKADLDAIAKPLFANIEGEQGVQQQVYTAEELATEFKLNDKQITMYQQVRQSVDASLERLAQTTIMAMADAAQMDIAPLKNLSLAETAKRVKDGTHDGQIGKNIGGMTKQSELHERIDQIVAQTARLQEAGYMPAMRFGNYAVTVTDPNALGDNVLHFEMFESQMRANIEAKKLANKYPGMSVSRGVMNQDRFKMFKGVSPETVELFAKFSGMDKDEAYKDYIALAKSGRSTTKRMLERKGVAGFSEDVTRVLASFITSNARQSAMNINTGEINSALASKSLARKGDVQREAQLLHEYLSNPQEEAQRLRGFMFINFIGGSIASAAVNLTQPILQTGPYLTQYAGSKTASIIAAAGRMAATGKITNPELNRAMTRAKNEGITDPHEIHNLMADASGSTLGGSLRMRAITKAWGSFFSVSEAFNRRLTFLAAYQTAMSMGPEQLQAKGFKDAYEFSRQAIIETQGLYSKTNRPNWARGAIGATLFTFKQFSISYVEFLSRLPAQQKMIALAILVLAAGLQGLPFADDLEDVIDSVGQSMGYNTNTKRALRELAIEALGEDLGEILTHGLSTQSNIDLQGRLGMGNLIPGTALFKRSEKDKSRTLAELAGPLGSVLTSAQDAVAKAQAGHILGKTGALATMSPVAVRNLLQGAESASTGVYTDTKGRKVQDIGVIASFAKSLGFQPAEIAQETRKMSELMQDKGMLTAVSSAISARWAEAAAAGDNDGVKAAMETLRTWNRNNPDTPIAIKPANIMHRVREIRLSRAARFIKSMPKAMRAQALEDVG